MSAPEKTRAIRVASVVTHNRADETAEGIKALRKAAERAGVELVFEPRRAPARRRHDRARRRRRDAPRPARERRHRRAGVRDQLRPDRLPRDRRPRRARRRDRARARPAASTCCRSRRWCSTAAAPELFGINEVSFQRRSHLNMAQISYSIAGEDIGERVPCDGLIAATPAGLDRLQPLGRRADPRVGREGLHRQPDRAARAQRARAGGGSRGRAAGRERRPRAGRHRGRRDADRRAGRAARLSS